MSCRDEPDSPESKNSEDDSVDDAILVWPDESLHPVLIYADPRLRLHVGHCDVCSRDSARTIDQATACVTGRSRAVRTMQTTEVSA